MTNKGLNDFLGDDAPEPEAAPAEPVAETPAVAEAPAEVVEEPIAAAPEPAPEAEAEPEDVKGLRSALVAERKQRQDYKGERDRLAGEIEAMRRQVAEAEKARQVVPAAPAPPTPAEPATPPPDPAVDPVGAFRWQSAQFQQQLWNERLNMSEAMLRQQHGDQDVDEKIALFKAEVAKNPALAHELRAQAHPYRWAYDQAQRIVAMREIGPDPKAYETKLREKVEAEVRAQLEAQYANAPMASVGQPVPPRLPQSLSGARNAAPRSTAVAEEIPFEQMFERKRRA